MCRFLLFSCFIASLLLLGLVGCSSSSSSDSESLCEYSGIEVKPGGPIEVGLFEEVIFEITVYRYTI